MLDIKKVYVDTRYKTDDSKSDSDFTIELPRTLNIPENTVCYLTDVVLPVSWRTVDERNNKLYMFIMLDEDNPLYKIIEIPVGNYSGPDFCAALGKAIQDTMTASELLIVINVSYDRNDNMITIKQLNQFTSWVYLVSSADLQTGRYWSHELPKGEIQSLNGILRIGKTSYLLGNGLPWVAYLDLHTIRNIYITSSSLASYNIISNFGNDVIIKKIAVKANYSQMLFDTADAGYDSMDVSKRTLNRIDFRLMDSYGNIIDLRRNHWSFSLVFQQR